MKSSLTWPGIHRHRVALAGINRRTKQSLSELSVRSFSFFRDLWPDYHPDNCDITFILTNEGNINKLSLSYL
jgi:hypothetical protein